MVCRIGPASVPARIRFRSTAVVCLWLCVLSSTTFIGKGAIQRPSALPVCPGGTSILSVPSPELTIVAAHVGMSWFLETIAVAVRHPNVYLDVSAIPLAGRDAIVHGLLGLLWERGLEDRVLFGTDFPLVDPARYLPVLRRGAGWLARRLMRLPRMTAVRRDKLLGGNAARLLKL